MQATGFYELCLHTCPSKCFPLCVLHNLLVFSQQRLQPQPPTAQAVASPGYGLKNNSLI